MYNYIYICLSTTILEIKCKFGLSWLASYNKLSAYTAYTVLNTIQYSFIYIKLYSVVSILMYYRPGQNKLYGRTDGFLRPKSIL